MFYSKNRSISLFVMLALLLPAFALQAETEVAPQMVVYPHVHGDPLINAELYIEQAEGIQEELVMYKELCIPDTDCATGTAGVAEKQEFEVLLEMALVMVRRTLATADEMYGQSATDRQEQLNLVAEKINGLALRAYYIDIFPWKPAEEYNTDEEARHIIVTLLTGSEFVHHSLFKKYELKRRKSGKAYWHSKDMFHDSTLEDLKQAADTVHEFWRFDIYWDLAGYYDFNANFLDWTDSDDIRTTIQERAAKAKKAIADLELSDLEAEHGSPESHKKFKRVLKDAFNQKAGEINSVKYIWDVSSPVIHYTK